MRYCILDDRVAVEIKGIDAFSFLQSLITNDLKLLETKDSIYSLFLNAQGRFLFDAFIIKRDEAFLLDINKENSSIFLQKLNFYKLRSDVLLEIKDDMKIIYTKEGPFDSFSYKDSRYKGLGYRGLLSINSIAGELEPELYLKDKYDYAIPDGFIDLLYEKTLPPEYNLDKLNAISYTKGCYMGQEVMSRAKYQGELRKQLYKLNFNDDAKLSLSDKEIYQENNKIGLVTSFWKNSAIGLIRKELVDIEKPAIIGSLESRLSIPEWIKE